MTGDNTVQQLNVAAEEGLRYLIKAFRGAVNMEDTGVRALTGAAGSVVGAWSRNRATESAMAQTAIVRAGIFSRDLGGTVTSYLPDAPAPKALEPGK
jgi:hypothetical protein